MNRNHRFPSFPALIALIGLLFAGLRPVSAQAPDGDAAKRQVIEGKIQNALTAAPDDIAREAAVWDWPSETGGDLPVLRNGSNGWTCFPDYPGTPGNDPMCHDEAFLEWHLAFLNEEEPDIDRVALSYMLAGGGFVDDEGNPTLGPHVMMALPDMSDAEGIPRGEHSEEPYIFHAGTPYAIIVMPVAAAGEMLRGMQQH